MLFNSYEFLLFFLPVVFTVYFLLNKFKLTELSKGWLVIASLYFYAHWKLDYLGIILFSMIFNYAIGSTLSNSRFKINKKFLLIFGIAGNVALLSYYKYFDFLIKNLNMVFQSDFNYFNIILPLAISFFTFQQIAYLVDSYKGLTKEYDFLNYALFVTFFPQLIAGPIVHHKEMMPQFANLKNKFINPQNIYTGLVLLSIGLFKKVFIADGLSPIVAQGFDLSTSLSTIEAWIFSLSYTFQLYFDFSGYTDMALGIGFLFNIKLPQNFNSPYKAQNIQDFWRRWHMTLSRFLKNYVYIPLGGNKAGRLNTYRNLILTFVIGGIWHGAAWTFVLWGFLHGIGIAIHRIWQKLNYRIPTFIAVFTTFIFVNFCWVLFRAKDFDSAIKVLRAMCFDNFIVPRIYHLDMVFRGSESGMQWTEFYGWTLLIYLGILLYLCLFANNSQEFIKNHKPSFKVALLMAFFIFVSIINMIEPGEFLYFNF